MYINGSLGRLATDVKVDYSPNGLCYVSFVFVENDFIKGKQKPLFIKAVLFGKLAEALGDKLIKGQQIYIEKARLQLSTYEKEGEKRQSVSIIIEKVKIISKSQSEKELIKTGTK